MPLPIAKLFDLKERVAIVTGAAMGIGEAIAARLAEAGAKVVVADVSDRRELVAERIRHAGGDAHPLHCDVRQVDDARRAVIETIATYGGLDVLVNDAGIFPFTPALDLTEATWDRVMATNLKGAFFMTQLAVREMVKRRRGGNVINIASIDAMHPSGSLAPYDASKGALVMLTKSLAVELAPHKIRVNAIAPGAIATPGVEASGGASGDALKHFLTRIPLGRMGDPDDIATAALFLASHAADYVTGSTLVVDGGYLLS